MLSLFQVAVGTVNLEFSQVLSSWVPSLECFSWGATSNLQHLNNPGPDSAVAEGTLVIYWEFDRPSLQP